MTLKHSIKEPERTKASKLEHKQLAKDMNGDYLIGLVNKKYINLTELSACYGNDDWGPNILHDTSSEHGKGDFEVILLEEGETIEIEITA